MWENSHGMLVGGAKANIPPDFNGFVALVDWTIKIMTQAMAIILMRFQMIA